MEIDAAAVAAWAGVELVRALPGGARNTVLLAQRRAGDWWYGGPPGRRLRWTGAH